MPSPLKVAFVFMSMPVGGAEDFALTMARWLPPEIEASFVCLRELGVLGEEHAALRGRIARVPAALSKRWNFFGVRRLAGWLREQRIDLVHSQTYHAHTYAIPAARIAGCASVLHQQKTLENLPWHRAWTLRRLTRRANQVLALSGKTAFDLRTVFKLNPGQVAVVPNAVDPSAFFPAPDRAALRKQLSLTARPLVGAVASLNDVKNHDATLDMVAQLQREKRNFRMIFIGEGKQREHLTRRIDELDLAGFASLLGNKRPVAPWLQALDVLVLPSHWEGQPMILLQALACGIPVVASEIEGNVAVLGHRHPGLFPPGDLQLYTDKVRLLLHDPAFSRAILRHQATTPPPLAPEVAARLAEIYRALVPGDRP